MLKNFGGLSGVKNQWQLESLLEHIKNDKYYITFIDKLVHLFFGIIQFHCFNDGNKRTAIAATDYHKTLHNSYNEGL